jgi:hypothetical protein
VALLRATLIPTSLPLWFALTLAGAPAQAQVSTGQLQHWGLQNVRASLCVHFLMDSTSADKELPKGFRPVRASEFPVLSPALKNVITGEPEYQSWVPALWCSYYYDQLTIGDQTIGTPAPELDKTQYLGAWLVGAVPTQNVGPPTTASYYIATMRTPNWRWIRQAETSFIRMEFAESSIGKVPEGRDDRYRVEMGRTVITWDGRLAGDSASAATPGEQTWWALSSRGVAIRAQVMLSPELRQNVVGSLQIAGNDQLAKSLRASPIRMVGPLQWGGGGTLSFVR